jgi:hypothetical protein
LSKIITNGWTRVIVLPGPGDVLITLKKTTPVFKNPEKGNI